MEKNVAETIRNGVVGVLKGTREVAVGIVDLVSGGTAKALEDVRDVGTSVSSVAVGAVSGAIKAAAEIGADLTTVTKNSGEFMRLVLLLPMSFATLLVPR